MPPAAAWVYPVLRLTPVAGVFLHTGSNLLARLLLSDASGFRVKHNFESSGCLLVESGCGWWF